MMTLTNGAWLRRTLGAFAILAVQYSGGAAAQMSVGGTMPEALKNFTRASGVCRKEDAPAGEIIAPALRPDLSCAVGVSAVLAARQRQNAIMIDVRQSADYEAFHIDGALNASFSDLHSKSYWRNMAAVLVGSGKAERELYEECTRLKQLGYKDVTVLRGGMPTWLAANQPVMGRAPSAWQLARLSASEFWLESRNPDNLVVLGKGQEAMQSDIPFSVVLPQLTAAALRTTLERRRAALKNAPLASVIVAADAATPAHEIEQLQQAMLPIPVLVYTDTREAFVMQLAAQKALWLAQARGPKQPACGQ
jgi:rhodanese-related sulfurtransferase